LRSQSLKCSLHHVHLVARARRSSGEVGNACGSRELEDEVLAAVAEAYDEI